MWYTKIRSTQRKLYIPNLKLRQMERRRVKVTARRHVYLSSIVQVSQIGIMLI